MITRFMTDDFFGDFWNTSWTFGDVVDTRRWDIINGKKVPRADYRESLLKQKDKELKELDSYYENRKKEIEQEKQQLLGNKSLTG